MSEAAVSMPDLSSEKKRELLKKLLAARARRSTTFPASFAQERLWLLDQLQPGGAAYNMPCALRLAGLLNVAALEQVLADICQRHETLRTTFGSKEGQPVQIISPTVSTEMQLVDLSGFPEEFAGRLAEGLGAAEVARPFDLARGPLLRAVLFSLSPAEHVLVVTMHHIISDGWSLGVLIREVAALYPARAQGRTGSLPELPLQYADFSVWQRQQLQGDAISRLLDYWRKRLEGLTPLNLPTDRRRQAAPKPAGGRQMLALRKELGMALQELGRREGATLFMTLLAAFQTLLRRYTGQNDIAVGSPIAGRTRPETEALIGFFANMLVLRGDLSSDPIFRQLLGRARGSALEAFAHQDLPFEKLVEAINPPRDPSRHPLFQVLFTLQNAPRTTLTLPGLALTRIRGLGESSKFDLVVAVKQRRDELGIEIEYSAELFDAATIERLAGHFQTLLEAIAADPDRRISELPLLTEVEQRQLQAWNATAAAYPRGECLHELFESQAAQSPDAVALVWNQERLTYGQLNGRANRLASQLRSMGVGPEVLVGIYLERSLDMVVGLLGILKAGGAYVPLDPAYPAERVAFMLQDSQAGVVVTQDRLATGWAGHGVSLVRLDGDSEAINRHSPADLPHRSVSDNLAYVIYTSGSTGRPKGVAVEHRSAVTLCHWARDVFRPDAFRGVLASTSICFDLSVFELFVTLAWGGRAIIAENALQFPAAPCAAEVTLINTVPSAIAELVRANAMPASVRVVNLAGEPLLPSLVDRIYQQPSIERVYDLYGPTEDTTYSTFALRRTGGPATIGRPIANTHVYLLDSGLEPVPIGVPGEIYVAGMGLARAYSQRPDLTAERFLPNPFAGEPGARMYRTGDLARWKPDGTIEFLGRIDLQVKVRGHRVELDEIREVLVQHPSVKEAIVVAVQDAAGQPRLAAYWVARQQPAPTAGHLRSFLRRKLPEHMLPAAFVPLDALPLSANGKVDRRALPAPGLAVRSDSAFVAPHNPLEERLAAIWAAALKVERVGVDDNFFDLGGHSLLAAQVTNRLREEFEISLPLTELFASPTIAELALRVETTMAETQATPETLEKVEDLMGLRPDPRLPPDSPLVPLQPDGPKLPFYCVHGQLGHILGLGRLARTMDLERPFYGVRARELDGVYEPFDRIDQMAEFYVRSLRDVQPAGPYLLSGLSMGGLVALEMAQQLVSQGDDAALLVLLDTHLVSPEKAESPSDEMIARWMALRFGLPEDEIVGLPPDDRWERILRKAQQNRYVPEDVGADAVNRIARVWKAHDRATRNYVAQPYPHRVLYLQSHDPAVDPGRARAALDAWRKLCPRFTVVDVPGSHRTMMKEPHVRVMGELIARNLDKVAP